jgi:hypothetical protein
VFDGESLGDFSLLVFIQLDFLGPLELLKLISRVLVRDPRRNYLETLYRAVKPGQQHLPAQIILHVQLMLDLLQFLPLFIRQRSLGIEEGLADPLIALWNRLEGLIQPHIDLLE